MVFDAARSEIIMFGGLGDQSTYAWNGTFWQFRGAGGPFNVLGRTHLAYDPNRERVVAVGGLFSPATFEWDGTSWQQVGTGGPSGTWDLGVAYDHTSASVMAFGGAGAQSDDTWSWDGTTWTRVATDGPPLRGSHSLATLPDASGVLLFGGQPFDGRTWEWNTAQWSAVSDSGPLARTGTAMATDTLDGQVVLFGGRDDQGNLLADTWLWDGGTGGEPVAQAGGPYIISAGEEPTLDATNSVGSDGQFESLTGFQWDLGNDGLGGADFTLTEPVETVGRAALFANGLTLFDPLPVGLEVTDQTGATDRDVTEVIYQNTPPIARADGPFGPAAPGDMVLLDGVAQDADFSRNVPGEVLTVEWDAAEAQDASDVGDGFASAVDAQVSWDTLARTFRSSEAIAYLNVSDATGAFDTDSDPIFLLAPDLLVDGIPAVTHTGFAGQRVPLQWRVTNSSSAGTADAVGNWIDRVYVSTDEVFDASDAELGSGWAGPGTLELGTSYDRDVEISLPGQVGRYWLFVVADSAGGEPGGMPELEHDDNNVSMAAGPIDVVEAPCVDLAVELLPPPTDVPSGSEITLTFEVTNQGNQATPVRWTDLVFVTPEGNINWDGLNGNDQIFCNLDPFNSLGIPNPRLLLPGETYRQEVRYKLPEDLVGPLWAYVLATRETGCHPSYNIVECNGRAGKDNNLAKAQFNVVLADQPDLTVPGDSISFVNPVFSGGQFSVDWQECNEGEAETDVGNWSSAVYLSLDNNPEISGGDVRIWQGARGGQPLPADQCDGRSTPSFQLPIEIDGLYWVKVVADSSGNRVTEFGGENNNVGVSTTQLEILTSPRVDLFPASVGPTDPNAVGLPGQLLSATWAVQNISGAPAQKNEAWVDAIYLSTDQTLDGGDALLTTVGAGLAQGSDQEDLYERTRDVRLPNSTAPGSYYLIASIDVREGNDPVWGKVYEIDGEGDDEANNVRASATSFTVEGRYPNLAPTILTGPGSTGKVGDRLDFSWRVTNGGDADTAQSGWEDRVLFSTDASPSSDDRVLRGIGHSGVLAPTDSYDVTTSAIVPYVGAGNYFLIVFTDARSQAFENDDNDNWIALPFEVLSNAADLRVTTVAADDSAVGGDPINVTWRVENFGTLSTNTSSWTDRVVVSRNQTYGDGDDREVIRRNRSGALEPGGFYEVSAQFTLPLDADGVYYVFAQADADNRVFESSDSNNTRQDATPLEMTKASAANLTAGVPVSDEEGVSGQTLRVDWTVSNMGEATTNVSSWVDSVYLSRDQILDTSSDVFLGSITRRAALAQGEDYIEGGDLRIPLGADGPYFVLVRTDTQARVYEDGRRSDNTAVSPGFVQIITLPPADLTVADVQPETETMVLGEVYEFTRVLRNASSDSPVRGGWRDALFLSTDETLSADDRRIFSVNDGDNTNGTFSSSTGQVDIEPGETRAFTARGRLPGVTPGQYFVLARADVFNSISETDEFNNGGVSATPVTVTAIPLTLDIETQITMEPGRTYYFQLDNSAVDETLSVLAETAGVGFELYGKYGEMPSAGNYEFVGREIGAASQRAVVESTSPGTYYFLARPLESQQTTLTLRPTLVPFGGAEVLPSRVGNSGEVTLRIRGADFDAQTRFELRHGDQSIFPVFQRFLSRTVAIATFDLAGTSPGAWDLYTESSFVYAIPDENGTEFEFETVVRSTAILSHAVLIDQSINGGLQIDLTIPSRIRAGVEARGALTLMNSGGTDIQTPIVYIDSIGELRVREPASASLKNQLQLLPLGAARPGRLVPGESVVIPLQIASDGFGRQLLRARTLAATGDMIDWSGYEGIYEGAISSTDWPSTWARATEIFGGTWNSLHDALRAAAIARTSGSVVRANAISTGPLMRSLLLAAERGTDNVEALQAIETQFLFPTDWVVGEGLRTNPGECQSVPGGCEPFSVPPGWVAKPIARDRLFGYLRSVGASSDTQRLFSRFFDNTTGNYIQEAFDPEDALSRDVARTLEGIISGQSGNSSGSVRGDIRAAIGRYLEQRGSSLPDGRSTRDLHDVLIDVGMEYVLDRPEITFLTGEGALVLGGVGSGGPDDAIQDARRIASGSIAFDVTPAEDECREDPARRVDVEIEWLDWWIADTLDFCPGNCIGEWSYLGYFTDPQWNVKSGAWTLSKLEAEGLAWDVGIFIECQTGPIDLGRFTESGDEAADDDESTPPPAPDCIGEDDCAGIPSPAGGSGSDDRCGEGDDEETEVTGSRDPNDKTGPSGFGDGRWVGVQQPLRYLIRFENVEDATAAAARVVITDELAERLLAGSVRLGEMGFGDTVIETSQGLPSYDSEVLVTTETGRQMVVRVLAGVVAQDPPEVLWIFNTIDPLTGEPPQDPRDGFLPPNDETRRGEGFVEFLVYPERDIVTGEIIENGASIVFDTNEPILTNVVWNTIDADIPFSGLGSVPPIAGSGGVGVPFTAVDPAGAGLGSTALLASRDGGQQRRVSGAGPIEQGVMTFNQTEPGVYALVSQATDAAGNSEALPSNPDAVTTVPGVDFAAGSDTGEVGDGLTAERRPQFVVISAPLSDVPLTISGPVGTIEADVAIGANGRGTFRVPFRRPLPQGQYVVSTDHQGEIVEQTFWVDATPPLAESWSLPRDHGSVGEVGLDLPAGVTTSEPRQGGVARVLVKLTADDMIAEDLEPSAVLVDGVDANGESIDLNGTTRTITFLPGTEEFEIAFEPPLPSEAVYCIRLLGVSDDAGNELRAIDAQRTIAVLAGDATNDLRVATSDVSGVRSLLGTDPIDPNNPLHVRSDIDTDGNIDQADVDLVVAALGGDLRGVSAPCGGEPGKELNFADAGDKVTGEPGGGGRPGGDTDSDSDDSGGLVDPVVMTADGPAIEHEVFGKKTFILLDTSRVAVLSDAASLDERLLAAGLDPAAAAELPVTGWWIVDLPARMHGINGSQLVVERLAEAGLFASPVLEGRDGLPIIPTPDLLVGFEANADSAALTSVLDAGATVPDVSVGGLSRTHLLRLSTRDGYRALAIAATLRVTGGVRFAESDFLYAVEPAAIEIADDRAAIALADKFTATSARVGLLTAGIDERHPDLRVAAERGLAQARFRDDDLAGTLLAGMLATVGTQPEIVGANVFASSGEVWMTRSSWLADGHEWLHTQGVRITVDPARHAVVGQAAAESMSGPLLVCTDSELPSMPGVVSCGENEANTVSLLVRKTSVWATDLPGALGLSPGDGVRVESIPAGLLASEAVRAVREHPSLGAETIAETFYRAGLWDGDTLVFDPEAFRRELARDPADLNGDGRVDPADLVVLLTPGRSDDLNGDGRSDDQDLIELIERMGRPVR